MTSPPWPTRVVLANPDEVCSPTAFREMLDEIAAGPEPVIDSLGAGELLAEMRASYEGLSDRDGRDRGR